MKRRSISVARDGAFAERVDHRSDDDGVAGGGDRRTGVPGGGHRVRESVVVCLRRSFVRSRPLRRNYVGTDSRPHVAQPRRARNSPAQRDFHRENASRSVLQYCLT